MHVFHVTDFKALMETAGGLIIKVRGDQVFHRGLQRSQLPLCLGMRFKFHRNCNCTGTDHNRDQHGHEYRDHNGHRDIAASYYNDDAAGDSNNYSAYFAGHGTTHDHPVHDKCRYKQLDGSNSSCRERHDAVRH